MGEPIAFEFEMATEKLKRHKSPSICRIPAELIKTGGRKIRSENNQLINSNWNKEELHEEWQGSINLPAYNKGDKTDCGNFRDISLLSITYKILSSIMPSRLTPKFRENYWGSSVWILTQQSD